MTANSQSTQNIHIGEIEEISSIETVKTLKQQIALAYKESDFSRANALEKQMMKFCQDKLQTTEIPVEDRFEIIKITCLNLRSLVIEEQIPYFSDLKDYLYRVIMLFLKNWQYYTPSEPNKAIKILKQYRDSFTGTEFLDEIENKITELSGDFILSGNTIYLYYKGGIGLEDISEEVFSRVGPFYVKESVNSFCGPGLGIKLLYQQHEKGGLQTLKLRDLYADQPDGYNKDENELREKIYSITSNSKFQKMYISWNLKKL